MAKAAQATEATAPELRRVGILGDVHTEDGLLASALAFLTEQAEVDTLLCTGDVVSGRGDADRCCALLREAGVHTVRGNHDRWFVHSPGPYLTQLPDATPPDTVSDEGQAFLAALPMTLSFDTPRGPLLLCHGTGTDDMLGVYPRDGDWVLEANHRLHAIYAEEHYRFLVVGHTHARMLRRFDHLTLVNPGTLRRDRTPGFLIADFAAGALTVYDLAPDTGAVTEAKELPL